MYQAKGEGLSEIWKGIEETGVSSVLVRSVLLVGIIDSKFLQGKSMQQCTRCICNEYLDNNISALFTSSHFRTVQLWKCYTALCLNVRPVTECQCTTIRGDPLGTAACLRHENF